MHCAATEKLPDKEEEEADEAPDGAGGVGGAPAEVLPDDTPAAFGDGKTPYVDEGIEKLLDAAEENEDEE